MAIKLGYAKIMERIYKRGEQDGVTSHGGKSRNPYKRADFKKMYQMGFDKGLQAITEILEEFNNRERIAN